MKLPNVQAAVVSEDKITGYLRGQYNRHAVWTNTEHPFGVVSGDRSGRTTFVTAYPLGGADDD